LGEYGEPVREEEPETRLLEYGRLICEGAAVETLSEF
jgi:hypothetical protein